MITLVRFGLVGAAAVALLGVEPLGAPALGAADSVALQAQQAGPQRGQMERGQLERRIMAQFAQLVRRELGLDSAGAAELFVAVDEFGEERRALQMRESALQRQLRGTGVYMSDAQSTAALEEFLAIKREELRLLEAEQVRLGEVLSPPQLLRFYALREQLGQRIRRLREQGSRSDAAGRLDLPNDLSGSSQR